MRIATTNQIAANNRAIKNHEKHIATMRSSTSFPLEFRQKKVEEMKAKITALINENEKLTQRLEDIDEGCLELEAGKKLEAAAELKKKLDMQVSQKQKTRLLLAKEKGEADKKSKAIYKAQFQPENDARKAEAQFERAITKIPDDIKRNLTTMPNNKGYRINGAYYMGALDFCPDLRQNKKGEYVGYTDEKLQGSPLVEVILEKKDGTLYIYETYKSGLVQTFAKKGQEPRKLISKTTAAYRAKQASIVSPEMEMRIKMDLEIKAGEERRKKEAEEKEMENMKRQEKAVMKMMGKKVEQTEVAKFWSGFKPVVMVEMPVVEEKKEDAVDRAIAKSAGVVSVWGRGAFVIAQCMSPAQLNQANIDRGVEELLAEDEEREKRQKEMDEQESEDEDEAEDKVVERIRKHKDE